MRKPSGFSAVWSGSIRMLLALLLLAAAAMACAQGTPDFTGQWKQDNERSQPSRKGDVTLRIEQHGAELTVETTIAGKSSRHAVQKYTTDGKRSASTGADGDTFYTSVEWKDASLVFTIEEHEDGKVLPSKETWLLSEGGTTLERVRERPNSERQTLVYRRMQ